MNDSVLLLASVIPMWMAVLLILSDVLEKLSKQLLSLLNHTGTQEKSLNLLSGLKILYYILLLEDYFQALFLFAYLFVF